jgi:hypothetical protein
MSFIDLPPLRLEPLGSKRAIRILHVEPAQELDADIQCRTEEICLGQNRGETPHYEALSYVWGGRQGDQPIQCNGCCVKVTSNCLNALRHLRYQHRIRTLWIDAICIDQGDLEEKNAQVRMMGDVYRFAKQTIVWLGPDEAGEGKTKAMFSRLRWTGLLLLSSEAATRAISKSKS